MAAPVLHCIAKQDQLAAAFPSCPWAPFERLHRKVAAFWWHKVPSLTVRWVAPPVTLIWNVFCGPENTWKQVIQHRFLDNWNGRCNVATTLEGLGPTARKLKDPVAQPLPWQKELRHGLGEDHLDGSEGRQSGWNVRVPAPVKLSYLGDWWGGCSQAVGECCQVGRVLPGASKSELATQMNKLSSVSFDLLTRQRLLFWLPQRIFSPDSWLLDVDGETFQLNCFSAIWSTTQCSEIWTYHNLMLAQLLSHLVLRGRVPRDCFSKWNHAVGRHAGPHWVPCFSMTVPEERGSTVKNFLHCQAIWVF